MSELQVMQSGMVDAAPVSKVFDYDSKQVRVIMCNGEPWFVLKDVCDILDISNSRDTADRLDDDEKNTVALNDGTPGNPNKTIVSEPGLYNVIIRSDKPEAKAFKRWVTHEVLPSIRKHGGYLTELTTEKILADPDIIIELATAWKKEREERKRLSEQTDELQIALDYSQQWYTVMKYNKTFKMGWKLDKCQSIGKQLSGFCRANRIEVKKCLDDGGKYGATNSYPLFAWESFMRLGKR